VQIIDVVDRLPRHPSRRYASRPPGSIKQIVMHHSATRPLSVDGLADAEAFARYHIQDRGWPGIGYDYVVGANGTVYKTNRNDVVNYHAGNANRISLGICLVGNFDLGGPPAPQWQSAVALVRELVTAYRIPVQRVIGHREVPAAKSCPGRQFDMIRFRREVIGK